MRRPWPALGRSATRKKPHSSKVLMILLVGDYTALNDSMIVIMQLVEKREENRSPS